MERSDRCVFLDMTDRDLADIISITKDNMGAIIREAWGVVWNNDFEDSFIKNLVSTGIVKTVYGDGAIVGYFWFNEKDNEGTLFINSIQLKSTYQQRGIGLQVLKWIEAEALAHDIRHLELAVQQINPKAIEFYQSYGFREVLRESGSIHMRKEIF